jgi:flagellar hook assembly protein FlgD
MKKLVLPIALIIVLSLCFAGILNIEGSTLKGDSKVQTDGALAFSVLTATYNGQYRPRNAGAIWITNSQNQFVKTIKKWASNYEYTLIRWIASSGHNVAGAITSASVNIHQTHNVTWNGTNHQGNQMPDGEYKINIEFTEHNASSSNMGKFKQISFNKSGEPLSLTIPNDTYFKNMSLTWTPEIVNGTLNGVVNGSGGSPISGAVISAGDNSTTSGANGAYSLSLSPGLWQVTCEMNGYFTQTFPNIAITAGETYIQNFDMSPVSLADSVVPSPQLLLSNPYPNPFSDNTFLSFNAKHPGLTTAIVYDIKGRLVTTLSTNTGDTIVWNGRNSAGELCANGVYYIKVDSGNLTEVKKTILKK